MGNMNLSGLLQLGIGVLSLFGAPGLPRNYAGGVTQILGGLEAMFAQPHEVGSVQVMPASETAAATQSAS